MRTRILLIVLVLALALGISAGGVAAQGADCAGGEEITITFNNWWGAAREELMNTVISNFNEVCPNITVENAVQPWDNREQLVATSVASSSPPNIIMTTRAETYQFAFQGLIGPIDAYVEASGINPEEIFYPGEINNQYFDGKLYSMPLPTAGGITGMMLYNKEAMREAGLDTDAAPMTWQDLEAAAAAISEVDDFGVTVLGASIGDSSEAFAAWLYTNGGALYADGGRTVAFNNEQGVQTLEWMVNFVNEYSGGIENVRDFLAGFPDYTTADHPFYSGELAIDFPNVSVFGHIANADPELWADTDAWGIAPRPYNGENPDAATAGISGLSFAWGYTIPSNQSDETKAAAYAFLEYLTTAEGGGCYFMFAQGRPSPIKSCNEQEEYYDANPYWDQVLEILENDISVAVTPAQTQINDILTRAVEEAFFGTDAKTALDAAAEEAQALLDEFWGA